MSLLVDTSALVAYAHLRDRHHSRAVELLRRGVAGEFGILCISDAIFDETVTLLRARAGLPKAVEFGALLLNSELELLHVEPEEFHAAWARFRKLDMSFTDCTSLAMIESRGLRGIITFDRGFRGKARVVE